MAKTDEEKTQDKVEERLARPGVTVELIVGDQWVDDLSGISLYRGFYRLASKDEIRKNKEAKTFGYIREEEKQPIAELPKGKDLSRVEKALRLGILKIYDPKNPTEYKERVPSQHRRVIDGDVDSGSRYSSVEEEKIAALLKLPYPTFTAEIKKYKSLVMLDRIFEAECEGRNPTAGPRKMYTDIIKARMHASDVGGVSRISSKESEIIKMG
jgi:hypothetical protein